MAELGDLNLREILKEFFLSEGWFWEKTRIYDRYDVDDTSWERSLCFVPHGTREFIHSWCHKCGEDSHFYLEDFADPSIFNRMKAFKELHDQCEFEHD